MKTQIQKQAQCFLKRKYFAKVLFFLVVLFPGQSFLAQVSYCSTGAGCVPVCANSNVAIGNNMLSAISTGITNTSVGDAALPAISSGNSNTAIGAGALSAVDTKDANAAFGFNTLLGAYGSYNSGLGAYADVGSGYDFSTAIGSFAFANATAKIKIGDPTTTVIEGQVAYTTSDGRFKTNIKDDEVKGLEFIKLLKPVVYNFDTKKFDEFLSKNLPESARKARLINRNFGPSTAIRRTGFIAQDVEKAALAINYDFDGVHKPDDENDNYSLAYGQFVVPLVKAVQEQQQMIEQQQQRIDALEKSNSDLLNKSANPTSINQITPSNDGFSMEQNIPNPLSNETVVKYNLPQSINKAYMAIYDLTGKQITTLPITEKGASQITLTSERLASGIYIYSIVGDGKILDSKRMVIADK